MIEFISFIVDMVNRLISLMADDVLTQYLGVPFLYLLIGFFIIWVVTNIFIMRPFVGGLFYDKGVKQGNSTKSTARSSTNSNANQYSKDFIDSNGGWDNYTSQLESRLFK